MPVDTITMFEFESGEMSEKQIVELLADLLSTGNIDNEDEKFRKLANKYIKQGVLDEEGSINYILLKE